MVRKNKRWVVAPCDCKLQLEIAQKLQISPVLAQICINRGYNSLSEIKNFISFSAGSLHSPFCFSDMDKAVGIIKSSINSGAKILVYGDYDVDGITGTSLLFHYLSGRNACVEYYIPNRLEEGYGLNKEVIKWAEKEKFKLIITVDCGISSLEETALAQSLGMKVIITDHHQPPLTLPQADAIINPKIKGSNYPFLDLAGVAVAWKLAQALQMRFQEDAAIGEVVLKEYLDLVCLGTIADVVSLTDENRAILKLGLHTFSPPQRPGIKALLAVSGLEGKTVTSGQIGFIIAPRLNAAGRLASARLGVELLLSQKTEDCRKMAQELDQENSLRQAVEKTIFDDALEMIKANPDIQRDKVIVLASEKWHPGVIGIVASRLLEKFSRPVILLSLEGEWGKGSGRSIEAFNLSRALEECRDLLDRFGGHKQAAGLTISIDNIDCFRSKINNLADGILSAGDLVPVIKIDMDRGADGTEDMIVGEIEGIAPFGQGNPCPVFGFRNLRITEIRTVGASGAHLKLKLNAAGRIYEGIGFNMAYHINWLCVGTEVDIACTMERNSWNGIDTIQFVIKDIQQAPAFSQIGSKNKLDIWAEKLIDYDEETAAAAEFNINTVSLNERTAVVLSHKKRRDLWHEIAAESYFFGRKRTIYISPSLGQLRHETAEAELALGLKGISVCCGHSSLSEEKCSEMWEAFRGTSAPVLMATPEFILKQACYGDLPESRFVFDLSSPLFILMKPEEQFKIFAGIERYFTGENLLVFTAAQTENDLNKIAKAFGCEKTYFNNKKAVPSIFDYRGIKNWAKYLFNNLETNSTAFVFVSNPGQANDTAECIEKSGLVKREQIAVYGPGQRPWQSQIIVSELEEGLKRIVISSRPLVSLPTGLFDNIFFLGVPPLMFDFASITGWPGENRIPKIHMLFQPADIKRGEQQLDALHPKREVMGKIFRALKAATGDKPFLGTRGELFQKLKAQSLYGMKTETIEMTFAVFSELAIIREFEDKNSYSLELVPQEKKCSLDSSFLYREGVREKEMYGIWRDMLGADNLAEIIKEYS